MKNIFIFYICFVIISCSTSPSKNDAAIRFNNREYNFGTISYKKEMAYNFEFTNPGKTPLVISAVKTSCGCAAADWTKEPVKPDKSGQITVKYDAAFPGVFHKTIKVHYNGEDSPIQLSIKGQVEYPENLEEPVE